MTRIHFRFDDNNLHVKENVYMYTTKFLTRLLNKQTYLDHIKNTINVCYEAKKQHVLRTGCIVEENMYVDENLIFEYTYINSIGYFRKYLRHVVNTYPDFLKSKKISGIWYYYAPYKILNIFTSETRTPSNFQTIPVNVNTTLVGNKFEKETDEVALLNSSYTLVKEFDNKRKEIFIDCDAWQKFKSSVLNYFNKKK